MPRPAKVATLPAVNRILPELASQAELAAYLGNSPRSLKRWFAHGFGPPRVKLPRSLKILYRRDAVLKWIAAHEVDFTTRKSVKRGARRG